MMATFTNQASNVNALGAKFDQLLLKVSDRNDEEGYLRNTGTYQKKEQECCEEAKFLRISNTYLWNGLNRASHKSFALSHDFVFCECV